MIHDNGMSVKAGREGWLKYIVHVRPRKTPPVQGGVRVIPV
jgi:hypothetical protein